MNSTRLLLAVAAVFALTFASTTARADSSVNQAFQAARSAVDPSLQNRVVSIYGTGEPDSIQKWYIIFYDPNIPSHGRAVLVQDNQIVKTYAANGGTVYRSDLTFDPSRLTPEGPALAAAKDYAAKHNMSCNSVRALLKQTAPNRPFRWRIELMNDQQSLGYVYVNALDSSVAAYAPPGSGDEPTTTTSNYSSTSTPPNSSSVTTTTTTTSSQRHSNSKGDFGTDVKHTFLGIGGDLQEFFTGERTVDKDDN